MNNNIDIIVNNNINIKSSRDLHKQPPDILVACANAPVVVQVKKKMFLNYSSMKYLFYNQKYQTEFPTDKTDNQSSLF